MQVQCLQILRGSGNTSLLLSLDPSVPAIDESGRLSTDIDLAIEFRDPASQRIIHSKSYHESQSFDFLSAKDPLFRELRFDLPPARYHVSIEVHDRHTDRNYLRKLSYECQARENETWISDIILLEETAGAVAPQPLVGSSIKGITDRIRFESYVYGPTDEVLTARAILYLQQKPPPGKDDREFMQINQYTAAVQINEVLSLQSGQAKFADGIDLSEMAQGTYLLELFLYRDDSLIAEKNTQFVIPWKRLKEVFLDLDHSIEQMAYLASEKRLRELKDISDLSLKHQRFMSFWENRADPNLEIAEAPLERYFSRIFYADEYFAEPELEGWKTDRGRAFTLYGSPDDQFNREWNGNFYEIWSYHDMGLDLVFAREGEHWGQVYPVMKN